MRHSQCAKADETLLPTRLLYLSRCKEGSLQVSLQETKNFRGRYACLSHRWGGSDKGTTRQDNYAQMLVGIPWCTIPKTFQEAMGFLYALGISYLWIDSYCIIQDNSGDWETESKQMASIFENSYLTIAATAAVNNESGCFWNEDYSHGRSLHDGDGVPMDLRRISIQKKIQHWERVWTSNRETHFPLLTRAWVFQERLLAPRVLHFSHQEFVWECAECGDCQCGGFDNRSNAKTVSWNMNNSWHAAVELYTALKLSRETDRLAAFHGFADFYTRIIPADVEKDYLTGLWRGSLHLDLLWRVESLADISKSARSLCRCWDTEIHIVDKSKEKSKKKSKPGILDPNSFQWAEESLKRSCQYSYSAACSITCLQNRRLCRYGEKSAAISVDATIEGLSCVDWHQEKTSIPQLFLCEMNHPVITNLERSACSSWSWASVKQSVKYWHDVVHDLRSDGDANTCRFFESTYAGAVSSRLRAPHVALKAEGYLVPALLQYQNIPIPESFDVHRDPNKGLPNVPLSHNILRYGLRVHSEDLDFHPDWILSLDGPRLLPNHTKLFLFHVTSNVYLVLKEKWFFDIPCHERVRSNYVLSEDLRKKIDLQKERVEARPSASEKDTRNKLGAHSHVRETSKQAGESSRNPEQALRAYQQNRSNPKDHASVLLQQSHDGESKQSNKSNNNEHQAEPRPSSRSDPQRHLSRAPASSRKEKQVDLFGSDFVHRLEPLSEACIAFHRVGILRVPWRRADSLHNKLHWIDKIRIE